MDLVYELFDKYMAQKDKLFLFYMVVALILMNEKVKLDSLVESIITFEGNY